MLPAPVIKNDEENVRALCFSSMKRWKVSAQR